MSYYSGIFTLAHKVLNKESQGFVDTSDTQLLIILKEVLVYFVFS